MQAAELGVSEAYIFCVLCLINLWLSMLSLIVCQLPDLSAYLVTSAQRGPTIRNRKNAPKVTTALKELEILYHVLLEHSQESAV